jgi:hypothetical protein
MDTNLLDAAPMPRFVRETATEQPRDELATALERERARRLRAERVASDMARMVAAESRRAQSERELRLEAEETASAMAALVAHENARAERAERHLRELLQRDLLEG